MFDGRDTEALDEGFSKLVGRENVKIISLDLSTTYRSAIKRHFPNASIVADRFHVHRLFTRLVNKLRKEVTGDQRKNPIRKLVLRNQCDLAPYERRALGFFLNMHPKLREVYEYKEAINRLYRINGYDRARKVLARLLDRMGQSSLERVKSLRSTILSWRRENLEYFRHKVSNGRVEGFNRRAKLLQRKAYGYSNF